MTLSFARPWLNFDLGQDHSILSWAINRPGFCVSRHISWREVRDADFTPDFDVLAWLNNELSATKRKDHVVLLTSRDVRAFETCSHKVEDVTAKAVVTVGLSNGERIGLRRQGQRMQYGTVNIALQLSCGLTQGAMLEALSIIAQARTAAILDHGPILEGIGKITGTGTDCIALACALSAEQPHDYAGLHTPIGEAIGYSVYHAITAGITTWSQEVML